MEVVTQEADFPEARLPPGATLGAVTEGILEVVMAAALAAITAAFPEPHAEAASLAAVDTEVGGADRQVAPATSEDAFTPTVAASME